LTLSVQSSIYHAFDLNRVEKSICQSNIFRLTQNALSDVNLNIQATNQIADWLVACNCILRFISVHMHFWCWTKGF